MTKTVLIIEDNSKHATLIRRILEARSIRVVHAADGESGLQMFVDERPDLVLLDLGLPDVDGQTIATFIRLVPELENVPMIVVTAWPEETAREMVEAYECDAYIIKPIDAKNLAKIVLAYLDISKDKEVDLTPKEEMDDQDDFDDRG
jgi:DNA-binding response OmpR family regulator